MSISDKINGFLNNKDVLKESKEDKVFVVVDRKEGTCWGVIKDATTLQQVKKSVYDIFDSTEILVEEVEVTTLKKWIEEAQKE